MQSEPVSYKATLYGPGEVLEASEEHMRGFLQAGYVKEVEAKEPKRRSKK